MQKGRKDEKKAKRYKGRKVESLKGRYIIMQIERKVEQKEKKLDR